MGRKQGRPCHSKVSIESDVYVRICRQIAGACVCVCVCVYHTVAQFKTATDLPLVLCNVGTSTSCYVVECSLVVLKF